MQMELEKNVFTYPISKKQNIFYHCRTSSILYLYYTDDYIQKIKKITFYINNNNTEQKYQNKYIFLFIFIFFGKKVNYKFNTL